ncbi:MAG: glycosyl transferase group 1, partial [uncultured bacterium (gcode 4)]
MKVAFVHCRISPGWALSVLEDLIDEQKGMTQATVFTLFSDRKQLKTEHHTLKIITALPSRVNTFFLWCGTHEIPVLSRLIDYRNLMFFYPILMKVLSKKIKKYKPDHIMISSFAIAKNITPVSGVPMTLYLHSPMQYIRTHYNEYKEKLTGIKGKIFNRIVPKLRIRDLKYTKFDKVYANSKYTAQEAKKLYDMQHITIKYPRIPNKFFIPAVQETPQEYYLYVGRLVNFVRETDKIIRLCNEMKIPLIVMGSGPDEAYLKSIAGPSIIFIGWINDSDEKIKIISQAKWLINLTKESYGIGTVEALLLGVPVFGYSQWATAELVDQDCGVLVENKHHNTLIEGFKKFMNTKRDRKMIAKRIREKWKNK